VGEKDPVVTRTFLRGFEPYVDDFEFEIVPDTGHFVAEQQPELVNRKALEFLGAGRPARRRRAAF
jgi:pimeloyl-ACP methyl ester carboxylesterase